ncbi:zinc-dependent alcohol dehydrogenase family protein [Sulfuriflexus mobilis]|uniref:zinc-dependent alcohol dehydrogenase family protein n=1 Tax=Sulfuriflexus mobilis TaxID=1811807 RepID=UPI000F8197BC|nr:zinc-dependent alcohol dehydrogenase family protein [Sulfuriflexus mobilis]
MPKIIRFYETGNADVLKVEEVAKAKPGKGEVRLKVEAIGLNRAEVMFREGQYLEVPEPPCRLGYEASGIIEEVGPDNNGLQVGDRVSTVPAFSMGQYGVYGENPVVPGYAVAPYPDNLTAAEGTAIWMQYITVFGALIEFGKLKQGDTLLITAASSSVGLAAIQIAKASSATVIAATRGADKKAFLIDAGADHVIITDEENLVDRVMAITAKEGANIIFDPIGGPILQTLADAAAQGGLIFEYGALSPEATPFPLFTALGKGLTLRGYTVFEITKNPDRLARAKEYIYERLKSGVLKPVIDRSFSLDNIVEAHKYMESGIQRGKIVITI